MGLNIIWLAEGRKTIFLHASYYFLRLRQTWNNRLTLIKDTFLFIPNSLHDFCFFTFYRTIPTPYSFLSWIYREKGGGGRTSLSSMPLSYFQPNQSHACKRKRSTLTCSVFRLVRHTGQVICCPSVSCLLKNRTVGINNFWTYKHKHVFANSFPAL